MSHFEDKRTLTEISTFCGESPYSPVIEDEYSFVKNKIFDLVPYYYYIQPDYNAEYDETNIRTR